MRGRSPYERASGPALGSPGACCIGASRKVHMAAGARVASAWRPRRHRACAALAALLLGVGGAAGQTAFTDRAALLVARNEWCTNSTAAAAVFGAIGSWDVSAVEDLSYVFCAEARYVDQGCNPACATFNDDVSGWNTSSVTTLVVRPLHSECRFVSPHRPASLLRLPSRCQLLAQCFTTHPRAL